MSGVLSGDWPLVGRAEELQRLRALLYRRDRSGVLLAGPAGVGKTRLAQECLTQGKRSGLATAHVRATTTGRRIPFGALAPLLPPSDASGPDPGEDRGQMLRRCAAALAERAADGRLVLLVDDAHLLDDASADLTFQAASAGSAFVLATIRSGEPAPDPVLGLWAEGLAERIDLPGLPPDAIDELLGAVLGGPVDRAALARLAAHSGDNVLFLRELVLGSVASGALRQEGGLWRLVGPLSPTDRLVETVEARLDRLTEAERSLLEVVAVGEPLGSAELGAHGDLETAEALERHALLAVGQSGRRLEARLAHPLYGEVLRGALADGRARELARQLADTRESTGARRREDPLQIATWRLDGGGEVRDDLMLAAAYQARLRWDLPLAERLAHAASSGSTGFDAGLLLGQMAFLQGRSEEAEARLAALVPSAVDDAQRALLATQRMNNLGVSLGRVDDAVRVGEEAEATIADQALADVVTAARSSALSVAGRSQAVFELLEPVLARAEGPSLVTVCQILGGHYAFCGKMSAALEVSRRGADAHRVLTGAPLPFGFYVHEALACAALTYGGLLREAEQRGRGGYDRAVADGAVDAQALFALFLARTLLGRGRVAEAERLGRESAQAYQAMGWLSTARIALIPSAWAQALSGREAAARATLAEIDALGFPDSHTYGPELFQARAWAAVAAGDVPAARRRLEEGVALAREQGQHGFEAAAAHDLARLGAGEEAARRLSELAGLVEGPLTPARAAHTAALVAGDAAALEQAGVALEAVGADLLAAEAAADAARAWADRGEAKAAAAAAGWARTLAAACPGAATPALEALAAIEEVE